MKATEKLSKNSKLAEDKIIAVQELCLLQSHHWKKQLTGWIVMEQLILILTWSIWLAESDSFAINI